MEKKGERPPKKEYEKPRKPKNETQKNPPLENEVESKNKNKPKGYENFSFEFVEDNFQEIFYSWLDYKRERRETFKSQRSLEACYKHLKKISDNNPQTAKEVIEQSFANNWQGLFELKNNKQKGGNNEPITAESRLHPALQS